MSHAPQVRIGFSLVERRAEDDGASAMRRHGELGVAIAWADGAELAESWTVPGLDDVDLADLVLSAHLVDLARDLKALAARPDAIDHVTITPTETGTRAAVRYRLRTHEHDLSFDVVVADASSIDDARGRARRALAGLADDLTEEHTAYLEEHLARDGDRLRDVLAGAGHRAARALSPRSG